MPYTSPVEWRCGVGASESLRGYCRGGDCDIHLVYCFARPRNDVPDPYRGVMGMVAACREDKTLIFVDLAPSPARYC